MPPSPQHEPGQRLAERFELREVLGIGGFGEVWLALDTAASDRPVALKILHAGRVGEIRVRERFIREAELLTKLNHPSIPRALDWRCDASGAFLALEYAEGQTLARRLVRAREEPEPDTLRPLLAVFAKTCEAVAHAHSVGVVHRDLKPPNILVVGESRDPDVRILDFGLAKILDADRSDETTKGRVLGSQNYLSPEQLGGGEISGAADIFALGAILFELLTSRRTWLLGPDGRRLRLWDHSKLGPNEVIDVVARILRGPRPLVRDYRPGYPDAIDAVVLRALAIEPKDRWPSAVSLAEATASAMAEWLEETRPAGLVAPVLSPGGLAPMASDEQWAIPTNSGQIEQALNAPPVVGPVDASAKSESGLDVVVPTDLEAPPGEHSFSAHTRRFIDTYAPFVRARSGGSVPFSRRILRTAVSAILTGFFAIGVLSGALRVWEEIAKRRSPSSSERPANGFGVVSGLLVEEEAVTESPATEPEPARVDRSRLARSAGGAFVGSRSPDAQDTSAPPEPKRSSSANARLRKVEAAMREARVAVVGERASPSALLNAVTVLRAAIQRDLPADKAKVVEGALDIAARSMEMSRLERAYALYRKFGFPEDSEEPTIDPLD